MKTTIYQELAQRVRDALAQTQAMAVEQPLGAQAVEALAASVVERPRDPTRGDYASAVALRLAPQLQMAPLPLAQAIVEQLALPSYITSVAIASPGFINFHLDQHFLQQQVDAILKEGAGYGRLDGGRGKRVQIEFVSANPTGPLTVGHAPGAVIGDTMARAMDAYGFDVTREYYFNDAGRQIELLGQSLYIRYRQLLGEEAWLGDEHYQGEYLYWLASMLVAEHGDSLLDKPVAHFSQLAREAIFASIRATVRRLGISFDVFYNEHELYTSGRVWEALAQLRERGYVYEDGGAQWFRSTSLGDDKDRVLVKSSGEPTYRMSDIAYHWHKAQRGFDRVVDVFGADHHATAPTVLMGVKALGYDPDFVHVLIHQFVTLVRDGEQVRMSTRRGHFVTLDELMDEVGVDAVRYFMLSHSSNNTIEFDLNLAAEQSDKNPVYYIQNAHVRCASILRQWEAAGFDADADAGADLSLLTHENELAFLRQALELNHVLTTVVSRYEPHHLAFYAYDVAARFHKTYETCRVLHGDVPEPLRYARLRFYRAAKQLFANVLTLMGMSAPERM